MTVQNSAQQRMTQEEAKQSILKKITDHAEGQSIRKQLCLVGSFKLAVSDGANQLSEDVLDLRWEVQSWGGPISGRTESSLLNSGRALSGTFFTEAEIMAVSNMIKCGELIAQPLQNLHGKPIQHLVLVA